MNRVIHFLKIFSTLYVSILISCKTKDSINTKNIFEEASQIDSLSYYFPYAFNDSFDIKEKGFNDFSQKWFSSTLYSFKEPILNNRTDSQTIYRLLWLRSFDEPVCFVMKEFKGQYFLSTIMLERQPLFYSDNEFNGKVQRTGKEILDTVRQRDRLAIIIFDKIRVLTIGEWNEIENYLTKIDFWKSLVNDPNSGGSADGATWVIEGCKDKKYHYIRRKNDNEELTPFGKYLINLSGVNIKDERIY